MNNHNTDSTISTNQRAGDMRAARARYGCGRSTVEKIADATDGRIRIGRRVLYDFARMDRYFDDYNLFVT